MTDDEFFDATEQLRTIRQWAHARFAATWAVFLAVLLRVCASTSPGVQLPGVIGGPASLNMIGAFVSPSGGGKGISDKVGRLAWPAPIIERPIGSGEGIAALFAPPKKQGVQRITQAIINVSEIDSLAGIASRQGSILLAQLKAAVMGELIGQSNASETTTRIVLPHTYRCVMSIGAQPGHCDVIFNDTSGGTPQRVLWVPTTDPNMPSIPAPDPAPLDIELPAWSRTTEKVEILYGPDEIRQQIIAAHLARQRGESDALDGHRMLTRCKVAAGLAVLHHRSVVSELDWQMSAVVMAVSDQTREWIIGEARRAARAKVRERAIGRATFDEIIDERHGTTVRNRILRLLSSGPMSRSELRRAMGKQHYREAFDAVLPRLEKISQVVVVPGGKAPHYALNHEFTGEPEFTPENSSSATVNREFTGEPDSNVTDLDSRRSCGNERPKLSAAKWFNNRVEDLRAAGHTTAESFAVYQEGQAAGYNRATLAQAASNHPDIVVVSRSKRGATWSLVGDQQSAYRTAGEFFEEYLASLPDDAETIDQHHFRQQAKAAGYENETACKAALRHPRVDPVPAPGRPSGTTDRVWRLKPAEEAS